MTAAKKKPPAVVARLAPIPTPKNGHNVAVSTNEQLGKIQQAPGWATHAPIQDIVKLLLGNTSDLGTTLTALANARALVLSLETTRDQQIATIVRNRKNLEGSITSACAGDPTAVIGWGCLVQSRAVQVASNTPPEGLVAKPNLKVLGALTARCKAIPGSSYLWYLGNDASPPPAGAQPVVTQKARLDITGQPLGHTLYLRVAAVRRNGGQSVWSDPIQVVVR